MEKGDYQIRIEKNESFLRKERQLRITKDDEHGHKAGDIVTVAMYGTFGCWDTENRWVNFYTSEFV